LRPRGKFIQEKRQYGALGDTSTLADPTVVDDLVTNRQNKREGAKVAAQ
jgi:hypothetical protein